MAESPAVFELLKTDSATDTRLGRLTIAHGVIDTPMFMPVGSQASVKALDPREMLTVLGFKTESVTRKKHLCTGRNPAGEEECLTMVARRVQ